MPHITKTHRFGLLTPSSNTTQEPEFSEVLPRTVSLHTGRLGFTNIDADTMLRCVEELETESRKLADAEVGVIVLAATAPSLTKGKGYDRELIKRMEDASGRPATTASTAFVEALTLLGIRRIAIAAPWSETMNKTVVSFIEANGFEVVSSEVMGLVRNTELGRVDPETAYELGRRADRPDADAVMLPGGNWPTMSVVERLEQDLGKPVLTNNAASIWAGLRILQNHDTIAGYGRLLRDHLGRDTTDIKAPRDDRIRFSPP
ncbi:MAG: maleate cis-trans isomerase [Betaproteobacteria bacterium]|nr:maleate cis-trans isomerase [Betaproteobacteria bacterium]